jgi:hypothetical protein
MKSHRTPKCPCLSCGKKLDAASVMVGGGEPSEGSISICLYCGHIMAFDSELRLRELSVKEIYLTAGDPRIIAIQKARGEVLCTETATASLFATLMKNRFSQ